MKKLIKNIFKMPLATYKCSTVWIVFFSTLFLSAGFTTLATQLSTQIDRFNITETQQTTIGDMSIKSTSGFNKNGFINTDFFVYKYDASAPSGSRFTEITDYGAIETLSTDAGDRLYIGTRFQYFSFSATVTQAKTSEKYIVKYSSSATGDLLSTPYMSMRDPQVEPTNKSLFENIGFNYLTISVNAGLDWQSSTGELDKYPNTISAHYWLAIEVPPGGIATPAKARDFAWRGSGQSKTEDKNSDVYWGISRILKNVEISTEDFSNGGVPELYNLAITSTQSQRVHRLRNALGDSIKYRWALPEGIDTSTPIFMNFVYSSSQAINTANIRTDLKINKMGSLLNASQISDYNQTVNFNIPTAFIQYGSALITSFDISSFIEDNVMYIEIQRTDNNGGDFYPLTLCINYYIFKEGKL